MTASARGPAGGWSFADAIVVHNQDLHGIRIFFAAAAALAWFVGFFLLRTLVDAMIGVGWGWLVAVLATGALVWWFAKLHGSWRRATAARRAAYGLPTQDEPGAPEALPTGADHPVFRWLLAAPRWTQRAWAAHRERIQLEASAVNAGDDAVMTLGPDPGGRPALEVATPAVLDAMELLGLTERIPETDPVRIRLREQVRTRLFPPAKPRRT